MQEPKGRSTRSVTGVEQNRMMGLGKISQKRKFSEE
jgi:hypothetical protein